MKRMFTLLLLLTTVSYGTKYYVRADGNTSIALAAAIGPATDPTKCMSMGRHTTLISSAVAGDTFVISGRGGHYRAVLYPKTAGVYYTGESNPVINMGQNLSDQTAFRWNLSSSGTNEYYLTTNTGANPSVASEPVYFWMDSLYVQGGGTLGSLGNLKRGYGNNDGLGFNTIYIRDDRGNPSTTGLLIERGGVAGFTYGCDATYVGSNNQTFEGITFIHSSLAAFRISSNARDNIKLINCKFAENGADIKLDIGCTNFVAQNCTFRNTYSKFFSTTGSGRQTAKLLYCRMINGSGDGLISIGSTYAPTGNDTSTIYIDNCDIVRSSLTMVSNSASSTNLVYIRNSRLVSGSDSSTIYHIVNDASTVGDIRIKNSFVARNGHAPGTYGLTGCTDLGGNTITAVPGFKARRYPKIFVNFGSDDYGGNSDYWQTLASYANTRGIKLIVNVQTRKPVIPSEKYAELASFVAAGNEVACHTATHSDLSSRGAINIRYVGSGSACAMTYDTTTKHLTTSVTGASDNIDLDLSNVKINRVRLLMDSLNKFTGKYTATSVVAANGHDSCFLIDPVTNSSILKPYSNVDIKTAVYRTDFDSVKFFRFEVTQAKTDIETGIGNGYVCKSFAYPYTNSDSVAWRFIKAAGFTSARSGIFPYTTTVNMYSSPAEDANFIDTNNIERDIVSMIEGSAWLGYPVMLFSHGQNFIRTARWQEMFNVVKKYIDAGVVQSATQSVIADSIRSKYTPNSDSILWTYNRSVDDLDLRQTSYSTTKRSGDTLVLSNIANLYDINNVQITNASGHVLFDSVSLGSYQYDPPTVTVQPSPATVNAGQTATFTVTGSSNTINYQWWKRLSAGSWSVVNGATFSSYTTSALANGDNGSWIKVALGNSSDTIFSDSVPLIVNASGPADDTTLTWVSTSSTDGNLITNYACVPAAPSSLNNHCVVRFIDTAGVAANVAFTSNTTVKSISVLSGFDGASVSWAGYKMTAEYFNFADNCTYHLGNGFEFSSSRKRSTIAATTGTVTSSSCTLFVAGPRDSLNDAKGCTFGRLRLRPNASYYQWGSNNTAFASLDKPVWAEGGITDTVVLGVAFNARLLGSGDFIYQPTQMVWTADAAYILWLRSGASNIRCNVPAITYTFTNSQVVLAPDASMESDSFFLSGNLSSYLLQVAFTNSNARTSYFSSNGYNITTIGTLYSGSNQATTSITKWDGSTITAAAVDFSSYNGGTNLDSMGISFWNIGGSYSKGTTHQQNWKRGSRITFTNTASISGSNKFNDVVINASGKTVTTTDSVIARTVVVQAGSKTGTWKWCGINSVTPSSGNPGDTATIRVSLSDTTGSVVRFGSNVATKVSQTDSVIRVIVPSINGIVGVSLSQSAYTDTLINGFASNLTISYTNSPAVAYVDNFVAYSANILYEGIPVSPDSTKVTSGTLPTGLSLISNTGAVAGTPTVFKMTYDSVTITAYYGASSNTAKFKILVTKIGRDTVTASGNWTNPAIWSLGRKPANGDTVCQYGAYNTVMDSNFTVGKVHILSTGNFSMNGKELTTTAGGLVDRGSGTRDLGNKIKIMGDYDSLIFGKNVGTVTSTLCNYEFGGKGRIFYRTSKRMRIKSFTLLDDARVFADSIIEDTTWGTPALDVANSNGPALTLGARSQLLICEPGGFGSGIEQFGFWAYGSNLNVYSIHPTAEIRGIGHSSSFFGITTGGGNLSTNLPGIRAYGLTYNNAAYANAQTATLNMTGDHIVGTWETWFGDNYLSGIRCTLNTNGYSISTLGDTLISSLRGYMILTAFQAPSILNFSTSTITTDSLLTTVADSSVTMNLDRSTWNMYGGIKLPASFRINKGTSTFNFYNAARCSLGVNARRLYNVNINAPGKTVHAADTIYCRIRNVIAGEATGTWVMCGITAPGKYSKLGVPAQLTGQWTDFNNLTVRVGDSTRTVSNVNATNASITLPTKLTRNGVEVVNDYIVIGTTGNSMVDSIPFRKQTTTMSKQLQKVYPF